MGFSATYLGFPLALVGIVSGVLSLKGKATGFAVATLFYFVQCVRYYSPIWSIGFTSGFQAGVSIPLSDGQSIVFNVAAMAGVLYGFGILFNRAWMDNASKDASTSVD